MNSCKHPDFTANVRVNKFENTETVICEVRVSCSVCSRSMQFIDLPIGLSFESPSASADHLEARLPMVPYRKPVWISEEDLNLTSN